MSNYCKNCYELMKQLDQLKAENQQLKKAEEYDSRYNDLQAEIDCGNAIIEKYEKCLTEIKEYCTDIKKDHYWGMRMVRFANEILQKISECEVLND